MTVLENQARKARIDFEIVSHDEERQIAIIRVNGKEYRMSTHWRNYGRLDTGSTIYILLSSITNGRR